MSNPTTTHDDRIERVIRRTRQRCLQGTYHNAVGKLTRLLRSPLTAPYRSEILNDLGALHAVYGRSAMAQSAFSEALKIERDSDITLNNLKLLQEACNPASGLDQVAGNSSQPGRRDIYGFMHIATINHWREIVAEQFMKMRASGLWDRAEHIYVGLVGPEAETVNFDDGKVQVIDRNPKLEEAELPTLALLHDFCKRMTCDVFYVHTKGVTREGIGVRQWRLIMEQYVLLRYRDCVDALRYHNVAGCDWTDRDQERRHFSGNFWWAQSEYIRSLPNIYTLKPDRSRSEEPRHVAERWVGLGDIQPACLYKSPIDHYTNTPYPRSEYAELHEVDSGALWSYSAWMGLENRFQDLLEPIGPIRTVVEIGVEYGFSLFCFAQAMPYAHIIGIDPYQDISDEERNSRIPLCTKCVTGSDVALTWVERRLPRYPNVTLIKQSGDKASKLVNGVVDVIHIDAMHTYEAVKADFESWEPKLRPGGCVLFHGIESFPDDVGRFYSELQTGRKAWLRYSHGLGAWYKPH